MLRGLSDRIREASIVRMQEALCRLGVSGNTLTRQQKASLDQEGYLVLPDVMSTRQLGNYRLRLDQLYEQEGEVAGSELTQEAGCRRLTNLINKDAMFDCCMTYPPVLAAVSHILQGDFKTNSFNFRDPMPGYGLQRLHSDHEVAVFPGHYLKVNSLWLVDEQSSDNGPTRLVPRSHLSGQHPRDAMRNHHDRHPDEIHLIHRAGAVIIFNAHIWHGGTRNISGQFRRTLHASYILRDHPQQLNEREHLRPVTADRLSQELRTLMDV